MLKVRSAIQFSVLVLLGASATLALSLFEDTTKTILVLVALLLFFTAAFSKVLGTITWWKILWLLLFVSGLVFRERDLHTVQTEPLDGSAFFRIALVCATAIALLVRLSLRQTPWQQYLFRGLLAPLGIYAVLCLASSLWSVYPAWTIYKSLEFLVDVAMLAAIVVTAASARTYKMLFDWTWTLQGLLLMSVWLGLFLWPQEALVSNEGVRGILLSGVMPDVSPNSVSELGAVIGVVAFCRLLARGFNRAAWVRYGILLGIGILSMCLAQGRSAILGFVIGTFLALVCSGRVALSVVLGSTGVVLLSLGSVWERVSGFMRRGQSNDALYHLSDRLNWWALAWPKIFEHPLSGYGAFAGARFFVMAGNKIDAGIHSDWIEILVGTGFLGFMLALFVCFATWRQFIKSTRDTSLEPLERQLVIEAIAVLGVESIRSIFTTDLFWHPPIIFFACLAYAEFLRIRQQQKLNLISLTSATI